MLDGPVSEEISIIGMFCLDRFKILTSLLT